MGSRYGLGLLLLLLIGGLSACAAPATLEPGPPHPPTLPEITLTQPPAMLCSAATHLRFAPRIQGVWPAGEVAAWTLTQADDDTPLSTGTWSPDSYELFAAFPGGAPLPAGEYVLTLRLGAETLLRHTFAIGEATPTITRRSLALTPAGPEVNQLEAGTRLFYLRYSYAGACTGAPVWATVRHADALLCTHRATLTQAEGDAWIACYREDGQPLESGDYQAELLLMGAAQSAFSFQVAAPPPLPTATPLPPPVECETLFIAAGLAPEGTPQFAAERFEWHTRVVHAGSRCTNLRAGMHWSSRWLRDGVEVRAAEGFWDGAESGLLWDSFTSASPTAFLLPGNYNVTLLVDDTLALTGQFRLVGYVPPTTTEP